MSTQKTKAFRVTLHIPEGATVADCRTYIEDAVRSWCGGYRPAGAMGDDDPIEKEIEITSEMIEAGTAVMLGTVGGADLGGLFDARDLAARVYRAMDSLSRSNR